MIMILVPQFDDSMLLGMATNLLILFLAICLSLIMGLPAMYLHCALNIFFRSHVAHIGTRRMVETLLSIILCLLTMCLLPSGLFGSDIWEIATSQFFLAYAIAILGSSIYLYSKELSLHESTPDNDAHQNDTPGISGSGESTMETH